MNTPTAKNIKTILDNYEFVSHENRMKMINLLESTCPNAYTEYKQNLDIEMNQAFKDLAESSGN